MLARQHRRANRRRRIQHLRLLIYMPTKPHALLRPHAVDGSIARGNRGETEHARRANVRLRALDEINFQFIAIEPHGFHAPGVVAPMPLHVHIAFGIGALAERGWKL